MKSSRARDGSEALYCLRCRGTLKRNPNAIDIDQRRVGVQHLTEEERFWLKVDKTQTCWLWTARLDKDGYGQFQRNGDAQRAHRIAYEWEHGPVPAGLQLDHLCRVKNCVRPDHLELVTVQENIRRMYANKKSGPEGPLSLEH